MMKRMTKLKHKYLIDIHNMIHSSNPLERATFEGIKKTEIKKGYLNKGIGLRIMTGSVIFLGMGKPLIDIQ